MDDIVSGGLIAIGASVLTMVGTLSRDYIQAKREKKARERQELLAACKAFLRGVEIRQSHMIRAWLDKTKPDPQVVTEGLHEVIRGNADVQFMTSSRDVAEAADELWRSLYGEKGRPDPKEVNKRRAAFIAAARRELKMPQFPHAD